MAYQPIIVLSQDSQQTSGRDAQRMNIAAAKAVAETVRSTLGPMGMDKMLVDSLGDVVITNDGATILSEMDIEHPTAQMIIEVADSQEEETGDGTTTAVVLTGELLLKAEDLLDEGIHPTTIISGYRLAAKHARGVLESIAFNVEPSDTKNLLKIAKTSMTGKGVGDAHDHLSDLVVRTIQAIEEDGRIDLENIKIETIATGSIDECELIEGVLIDKEPVHENMPTKVINAKIALLGTAIEIAETETDAEISVTDPSQLQQFIDAEEQHIRDLVSAVVDAGANVVFVQKGIDDLAQHYLAKEGILAIRRCKKSDLTKLSRATGAKVVSKISDITSDDLGSVGLVEQRKIGDDEMLFVVECDNPKSVSLILRGGTEHVVEEVERALNDALEVVRVTIQDGRVVAGGGSPEVEVSLSLRNYADSIGGREQLAIESFADAVEAIPRTLATNSGLDPIDSIVDLRAQHTAGHVSAGLSAIEGGVSDMLIEGVIEPLRVKTQAISSAQEATDLVLRIDDVIAAGNLSKGGEPGFDEMGM